MTTYVEARDDLVALVESEVSQQYADLPVLWENTAEVDLDSVGNLFLRVFINFDDASQLTMNGMPEFRVDGSALFVVFYRQAQGVRSALALIDHLMEVVKFRRTARLIFSTPSPGRKIVKDGWVSQELEAPFHFTSLA